MRRGVEDAAGSGLWLGWQRIESMIEAFVGAR